MSREQKTGILAMNVVTDVQMLKRLYLNHEITTQAPEIRAWILGFLLRGNVQKEDEPSNYMCPGVPAMCAW